MKNLSFKFLSIIILLSTLMACGESKAKEKGPENKSGNSQSADSSYIVDVKALDYAFAMPEEIPSGWVTFRMKNMGKEEHIAFIAPAPDSMNFEQTKAKVREAIELGQDRDWHFSNLSPGPFAQTGLVSPGQTAETTVKLNPGNYFMLCDVKTAENVIHDLKGMVTAFHVTDKPGRSEKPKADIEIKLSKWAISTSDPIGAGAHTFAVHAKDGPVYVEMARLKNDQTVWDVVDWFHLFQGGPSPFEFIGGVRETNIFRATLTPGRYALVSPRSGVAGSRAEIVIPENGKAPALSSEPVNAHMTITFPDGDSVFSLPTGRTSLTLVNRNDSTAFMWQKLRAGYTEEEYYDFIQPAGLHDRSDETEPNARPMYGVTYYLLDSGERKEISVKLSKGTYFLCPFIREHYNGKRALTSAEMDMITKIVVQ